jgi:hypothetical protein
LKNITINISKEIAIEAFNGGVCRVSLKEEQGRSKPKSIAQLMDIAKRWVDGEDHVKTNHAYSPDDEEADPGYSLDHERRCDRRRKCKDHG